MRWFDVVFRHFDDDGTGYTVRAESPESAVRAVTGAFGVGDVKRVQSGDGRYALHFVAGDSVTGFVSHSGMGAGTRYTRWEDMP